MAYGLCSYDHVVMIYISSYGLGSHGLCRYVYLVIAYAIMGCKHMGPCTCVYYMRAHSSIQTSLPMRIRTLAHTSVHTHAHTCVQMHIYAFRHFLNPCVEHGCLGACSVLAIIAFLVTTLLAKFSTCTARYKHGILSLVLRSHPFFRAAA